MVLDNKKSQYVVVDTSAFIRNTNLQDFAEYIITVPEVVHEITYKRQLRRLAVLPYDLKIKEAFPESIKHVTEFSKKTGDYRSLSSTDIKVLALTYQLEKEHVGVDHLRSIPDVNRSVTYCKRSVINNESIAGFYNPKSKRTSRNSESSETTTINTEKLEQILESCNISEDEDDPDEFLSACSDSDSEEFVDPDVLSPSTGNQENNGNLAEESLTEKQNEDGEDKKSEIENKVNKEDCEDVVNVNCENNYLVNDIFKKVDVDEDDSECNEELYSEEDTEDDAENDEDDESDWITPSNIKQIKQDVSGANLDDKPVTVACLTTDFSMQNVLKQMGLNVLALDGRVIRHMRTFIFRCYACYKTTSDTTKVFCPHCGNRTLKKVAVSVDEQGNQKIHINIRKPLTAKGKSYSLPKPTGGKHSTFPIVCEDQPMPQQRPTRVARTKTDALESDFIAGFSPFAMRDVNSKSAVLGIPGRAKEMKYWMQRNPNESNGKRKRRK